VAYAVAFPRGAASPTKTVLSPAVGFPTVPPTVRIFLPYGEVQMLHYMQRIF
jgi:hypothetical protein